MWCHAQWYIGISISDIEHSTPQTDTAGSSEMLTPVSQTTEHNIPQDH
jgi:hypothetical protein